MSEPRPMHNVPPTTHLPNALTFDVEEWFHAHNLGVPRRDWADLPSRLDGPIDEILTLLADHDCRATFFVLGWTAKRRPELVRRIADAGHEIASHGFHHESISTLTRDAFVVDVRASRDVLADITGERIRGYRAPRYSITALDHWAFDALVELGFSYDSSIYPARAPHRQYGVPDAPRRPFRIRPALWELPLPVWRVFRRRLPVATGAYLRLWPMAVTHLAFKQNRRDGNPVVVNIHPWELDPQQPRRPIGWRARCVHYGNLSRTKAKLATLLSRYRFVPLETLSAQARADSCRTGIAAGQSVSMRGDRAAGSRAKQANVEPHDQPAHVEDTVGSR